MPEKLDSKDCILVPTASLKSQYQERFAKQAIDRGDLVWKSPTIVTWSEFLRLHWRHNTDLFPDIAGVLSALQSQELWTQVIENTKYKGHEFTLLNVPQTVKACTKSNKLMSDWLISEEQLSLEAAEDIEQFLRWRQAFNALLELRKCADEPTMQSLILDCLSKASLQLPFSRLYWCSFDLITSAQLKFQTQAEINGVQSIPIVAQTPRSETRFMRFSTVEHELRAVFKLVKKELIEQPDKQIAVVIPDLGHRYGQVELIAKEIFYPSADLLGQLTNDSIYRFSLGKPLAEWAPLETALNLIDQLGGRISLANFSFLIRSIYLNKSLEFSEIWYAFELWLQSRRLRSFEISEVRILLEAFRDETHIEFKECDVEALGAFIRALAGFLEHVQSELDDAKESVARRALSHARWKTIVEEWLSLWGWQCYPIGSEQSSVAYQLENRWKGLLEEFASLAAVQSGVGMARGISSLQQLARDTVFLPQAANSPVVVSGILEALGRETDLCFLTGMTEDLPAANKKDAFIPKSLLIETGFPDATAQTSYKQFEKVVASLVRGSQETVISYSMRDSSDPEREWFASPIFRDKFEGVETSAVEVNTSQSGELENYEDLKGPPWKHPEKARGGASIFKNQSLCPFKAFATHQLRFNSDAETEFGLDFLDRGNVTHMLLEELWSQVESKATLESLTDTQVQRLLTTVIDRVEGQIAQLLSNEKLSLIQLERSRFLKLLNQWIEVEKGRPDDFSVVERESKYSAAWRGIRLEFIIDRLDLTKQGHSVLVDYKTGLVKRADWQGQRPREPQLPLYALLIDEMKSNGVSGFAVGQVRRGDCKYIELSEEGIFRSPSRFSKSYEDLWRDGQSQWRVTLDQLADEFLDGYAAAEPIDARVCETCELHSLCRIREFAAQQGVNSSQGSDYDC